MRAAFDLFTQHKPGPITLTDLRRVARTLREEVSDDVLKDMIVEANGEGRDGWRRGVAIEDFEAVMRRAGVFA
jgi:Ca2+-binding EF-hand superfamily protein